jgi:hypothetical protein
MIRAKSVHLHEPQMNGMEPVQVDEQIDERRVRFGTDKTGLSRGAWIFCAYVKDSFAALHLRT